LNKAQKTEIVGKFARKDKDTGSAEVQVALLTGRITELTTHMAANRKDFHTQLGLLRLVGKRRRMLGYLSHEDAGRYNKLIAELGLRK
jgi:small subunit ribosomal protein S15